jgi:hypothetical protein
MKNRILVAQAKQEWVNTMKRTYKNFNHKLWGRSHSYRMDHPQVSLAD